MTTLEAGEAPDTDALGSRRSLIGVGALAAVAAAVYSVYALVRFATIRATTYDLVIFDQAVRSYSRFRLPVSVAKGVHNGFGPHFVVLGDHFSPILVLLAPLYWLHDGPRTLLVAQSVLLAAAVVPLWVYARRQVPAWAASCIAGIYLLSWPVAQTVAFDFHETAFVPLLSLLMLERHQAGRQWQSAAAAAGLLLVKEDMGLLVAGFGLYLLTRRRWRMAAAYVVGGLAWTWLASRVLVPAFGGSADYYWAYGALGPDLPSAAGYMVSHPWEAVKLLVTPPVKATTMLWLAAPLLLLPLASPLTLAVLPLLAERMLSSKFGNWWQPLYHYNVALTGLLVAAGLDGALRLHRLGARHPEDRGWRRLYSWRPQPIWPVAALVATAAVVPHFSFGLLTHPGFYRRDAHAAAAAGAAAVVPDGALVEAANVAGPALSSRARVLLWDRTPRWAPWVIADVARRSFPFSSVGEQRDRVGYLRASGYHVVWQRDGYLVLNRPGSIPDLRPGR